MHAPRRLLFGASLVLLALVGTPLPGLAQAVDPDLWTPNGPVHAILPFEGRIHIGGQFDHVGPSTGAALALTTSNGAPILPYPKVNGVVNAIAPDGAGGWFLGGRFTQVGGQPRANIARVLADGSVSAWNPGVSGPPLTMEVRALAVRGSVVYVGGHFNNVGGQPRNGIAAIDANTGVVTPWNPDAPQPVYALATAPGLVYAGGVFGQIGGETRSSVAAIDSATGAATAWNPGVAGTVEALIVRGPTVYVGGVFDHVGGLPRANVAAIDAASGAVTAWNPGADNVVRALAASGSTIYIGGGFDHLGGQVRHHAGAVDVNGFLTGWNPNANAPVWSLLWSSNAVYVGGDFTGIGGQPRNRLAAVDPLTGGATAWDPGTGGSVRALGGGVSSVFVAGSFASVGGETRHNLAALDPASGALLPWNPGANGIVHALAAGKSSIFAGGLFSTLGGEPRDHLGEVEISTGEATAWNPDPDGIVTTLATYGGWVYAGGGFQAVGAQPRNYIAEIDAITDVPTAWNPNADFSVTALAVYDLTLIPVELHAGTVAEGLLDTLVYAGGTFFNIGGEARGSIAQLRRATGLATFWDPNAGGWPNVVRAILADPYGMTIVGGLFPQIGAQPRANIAGVFGNGTISSWNPGTDGEVLSLLGEGRIVYAGGAFAQAGGKPRNRLAALDRLSPSAFAWDPDANDEVLALGRDGAWVYAGGRFTEIAGEPRTFLARMTPFSLVDAPGTPEATALRLRCSPNPVGGGGTAALFFTLPRAGRVELAVFDVAGRRVATPLAGNAEFEAGPHEARLDTSSLSAGIYFVRLRTDADEAIAKVVLVD